VPEKAERIPADTEFDRELSEWAQERNIDLEDFLPDVFKNIQG
jgi:hypothetical protein